MENWQSGDVNAFETLFRQYERLVFRTAYLITSNRETAEDILQEVFIQVWRFRTTYDPNKGKITTWLHRITVNECIRKKPKKAACISIEQKGIDLPEIKHHSMPEEAAITRLEYNRLIEAMKALDTKYRSVLVLRYFNDLSYKEIADALKMPLGTVKSRLNHSLKYLKQRMAPGEAAA